MDKLVERLPEIISAAAQSHLGILALLSVALSVLAYFFFAKASEKIRVGIFVLLFVGVIAFGFAMFRVSQPSGEAPRASLSSQAKTLLAKVAQDPGGRVLFERYGTSVDLHTNGESLLTSKDDHRALTAWESALDELVRDGLLAAHGDPAEVLVITKAGYDVAAQLEKERHGS